MSVSNHISGRRHCDLTKTTMEDKTEIHLILDAAMNNVSTFAALKRPSGPIKPLTQMATRLWRACSYFL